MFDSINLDNWLVSDDELFKRGSETIIPISFKQLFLPECRVVAESVVVQPPLDVLLVGFPLLEHGLATPILWSQAGLVTTYSILFHFIS